MLEVIVALMIAFLRNGLNDQIKKSVKYERFVYVLIDFMFLIYIMCYLRKWYIHIICNIY